MLFNVRHKEVHGILLNIYHKLQSRLCVSSLQKNLTQFAKVDVFVNPVVTEFSPLVQTIPSKWPNKEVEPQIIVVSTTHKPFYNNFSKSMS